MKGGHKTVCEGKKCSMCDYLTWKSKERKKKKTGDTNSEHSD